MRIVIRNGLSWLDADKKAPTYLNIEGDLIREQTDRLPEGDVVLDAGDGYVVPGFIDIHLHGGGGHDFMEATPEAFRSATEHHLLHGTTALCPTSVSATVESLRAFLNAHRRAMADPDLRVRLLGAHLEGPLLSERRRGAHDLSVVKSAELTAFETVLQEFPLIRRVTAAPEWPGICALASRHVPEGVQFSMGHSEARGEEIDRAVTAGFTSVTHLFNAMSSYGDHLGKKAPGLAEKALMDDRVYVELIGDLVHVPADMFLWAYRNKTAEKMMLVTDALSAAGAPAGTAAIGAGSERMELEIREAAYLKGTETLAGSVVSADQLLRNAVKIGIPFRDAVKMLTETPAKLLGVDRFLGRLDPGMGADIVILDRELQVRHVICRGNLIR